MDESPVFVISTGRSGSTLLQRLLNCHPDLVIWGEHHGLIGGLVGSYESMRSITPGNHFPRTAANNPGPATLLPTLRDPGAAIEWSNPWSAEEYREQVRSFIAHFFGGRLPPGVRWGFKEIRYDRAELFEMLLDLFPRGQFLFLRRSALSVARSQILAWHRQDVFDTQPLSGRLETLRGIVDRVGRHYQMYAAFLDRAPGVGLVLDYEALVAEPRANMARIFEQIGLDPARFDWQLAGQVLEQRVSSTMERAQVPLPGTDAQPAGTASSSK